MKTGLPIIVLLSLTAAIGMLYNINNQSTNLKSENDFDFKLRNVAQAVNNNPNSTWKADPTAHASLFDYSQFKSKISTMEMLTKGSELLETIKNTGESNELLPNSFDSRTKWPKCSSMKEIRDQSACGSCWAFSSTEAFSDRTCIATNGASQPRLSPADLMSCCKMCGNGCKGGSIIMAAYYWQYDGIVTGDLFGDFNTCKPYPFYCTKNGGPGVAKCPPPPQVYPTPKCTKKCNPKYGKSYSSDKYYGKKSYNVRGEQAMKKELVANGPFAVAFEVFTDFPSYKTGVYKHTHGESEGGHAVKLIGYGEENGEKYWLIANSWTVGWGEKGYVKFIRGIDDCGIESNGVAALAKN